MTAILSVLALLIAMLAWRSSLAMAAHVNALAVQINELQRIKGLVKGDVWIATLRGGGKRSIVEELSANTESDAVRQLLVRGIDHSRIISLERKA